jgi:hypothetical protein
MAGIKKCFVCEQFFRSSKCLPGGGGGDLSIPLVSPSPCYKEKGSSGHSQEVHLLECGAGSSVSHMERFPDHSLRGDTD